MTRLSITIIICSILILLTAFLKFNYGTKQKEFVVPVNKTVISRELPVKSIRVLSANEYDISLLNGNRILGSLALKIPPEAKKDIINLLNNGKNPVILVSSQHESGEFTIDIHIDIDNQKTSLTCWLIRNKLVWSDSLDNQAWADYLEKHDPTNNTKK